MENIAATSCARLRKWSAVVAMFSSLGAAPGQSAATLGTLEQHAGVPVTVNLGAIPDGLEPTHPLLTTLDLSTVTGYRQRLFLKPLLETRPSGGWYCPLCVGGENDWQKITKDHAGFLRLTVKLSALARWGDGTRLLAKDFWLAWQIAQSIGSEQSSPVIEAYKSVASISWHGQTPQIVYIDFHPDTHVMTHAPYLLALPSHIEEAVWRQHVKQPALYLAKSNYLRAPFQDALWNGTFIPIATKLRHGRSCLAARRRMLSDAVPTPAFDGPQQGPGLKHHLWVCQGLPPKKNHHATTDIIAEPAIRSLYASEPRTLQSMVDSGEWRQVVSDRSTMRLVWLNQRHPILRDQRVRMVMAQTVDRYLLTDKATPFELVPAVSLLHPGQGFDRQVVDRLPTPDDALTLAARLRRIGWLPREEADGVGPRLWKSGRPLYLPLVHANTAEDKLLAQKLISQWASVGIRVQSIPIAPGQLNDEVIPRMRYEALALGSFDVRLAQYKPHWHSHAIPTVRNSYQGKNVSGVNLAKIDQLLEQIDAAQIVAKFDTVQQRLKELAVLLAYELPFIPLYYETDLGLLRRPVHIPISALPRTRPSASSRKVGHAPQLRTQAVQ